MTQTRFSGCAPGGVKDNDLGRFGGKAGAKFFDEVAMTPTFSETSSSCCKH
jgi:hypothetical protein